MNDFGDQHGMVFVVDILWAAREWRASYGAYYRKDRFTLSLPFHMKLNMIQFAFFITSMPYLE